MRTVVCRAGGLGVCRGSPGTTQLSRSPHSLQVSPTINYVCRSQALLGDPRGHLPPAAFPCTLKRLRNRTGSILETAKLSQGGPSISSGALDKGSGPNAPRGERQRNYERVPSPGAPSGLHPTQAPARGGLRHLQPRKPPTLGRRVHGRRTPHPEPQPRPP